jgi:hypothetical protein
MTIVDHIAGAMFNAIFRHRQHTDEMIRGYVEFVLSSLPLCQYDSNVPISNMIANNSGGNLDIGDCSECFVVESFLRRLNLSKRIVRRIVIKNTGPRELRIVLWYFCTYHISQ